MKFIRKPVCGILLVAFGCWVSSVFSTHGETPIVLASIFDLTKFTEDVVKDVIQHGQNPQPTNHIERPAVAGTNYPAMHPAAPASQAISGPSRVVARTLPATFQLPGNAEWFDTGISLSAGQTFQISAMGDVYVGPFPDARLDYETPEGSPLVSTSDAQFSTPYLAPNLVAWSLIGRIGTNGQPFQVGSQNTVVAPNAGEFFLSVNDNNFTDNSGSWTVTITLANNSIPSPATNQNGVSSSNVTVKQAVAVMENVASLTNSIPATQSPGDNAKK